MDSATASEVPSALFDAESPDGTDEVISIDAVAIPNHVARGGVPGESLAELLSRPRSGRVLGDVEVQDAWSLLKTSSAL